MQTLRLAFALLTLLFLVAPAAAQPAEADALNGRHPAEYYRRAAELFAGGRKDDAVFLFYLGQLRYRVHLAARPTLKRDGDPALFASLQESVGRPINEYAFGDIAGLVKVLDAVLAYDEAHADGFTPPKEFAAARKSIRDGLTGLKDSLPAQADSIRASRKRNGLENRS